MIAYETYSGEAPENFGGGRKCEWCEEPVNRYRRPQGYGRSGKQGPLLCRSCVEYYDPLAAIECKPKKGAAGRPKGFPLDGLQEVRCCLDLLQTEMATRIGVSLRHYGALERGERKVSAVRAEELAAVLSVSVAQLKGEA